MRQRSLLFALLTSAAVSTLAQQPLPVDFIARLKFADNLSSAFTNIEGLDAVPTAMVEGWFRSELASKSQEMLWSGEGYLYRIPIGPEPATGRRGVYGPPTFVDRGSSVTDALLRDQLTNKLRPIPGQETERLYVWVSGAGDKQKIGLLPIEFSAPMEMYVFAKASETTLQQLDKGRSRQIYGHMIERLEMESAALARKEKLRDLDTKLFKTAERVDALEKELARELRKAKAQQDLLNELQVMGGLMTLGTAIAAAKNVSTPSQQTAVEQAQSVGQVREVVHLMAGEQDAIVSGLRIELGNQQQNLQSDQRNLDGALQRSGVPGNTLNQLQLRLR